MLQHRKSVQLGHGPRLHKTSLWAHVVLKVTRMSSSWGHDEALCICILKRSLFVPSDVFIIGKLKTLVALLHVLTRLEFCMKGRKRLFETQIEPQPNTLARTIHCSRRGSRKIMDFDLTAMVYSTTANGVSISYISIFIF